MGLEHHHLPNLDVARGPLEFAFILWPIWLVLAVLAFQRAYRGNVVAAASTLYIEFVRGVPLITVLFMAQILLPLFLPPTSSSKRLSRHGASCFSAPPTGRERPWRPASHPQGQYEAAEAIGLNTFQQLRFIILPQALRLVIPPMTGQFIGLFKDTLAAIVGLFDLLNIANAVIAQPQWLGLRREAYFFITVIYYIGCYFIAAAGNLAGAAQWSGAKVGLGSHLAFINET